MKIYLRILLVSLLAMGCGSSKTENPTPDAPVVETKPKVEDVTTYANTITSAELKEMLYTYASDEFEGRETGEAGQKKAIEYLKNHYKEMGIVSPLGGDDYFQEVPLEKLLTPKITLNVQGKEFTTLEDIVSLGGAHSELITTDQFVYAGYGIDDEKYNDYDKIDVNGKVVVVKYGEPKNQDGTYKTSGSKEATKWSVGRAGRTSKKNAAFDNGAKAFVMVTEPELHQQSVNYYKNVAAQGDAGNISLIEDEANQIQLSISEKVAKALYPEIMKSDTPKLIERLLSIDYFSESISVSSENVVAYIKGTEKPDEVLVISAHLDHEGVKDGQIYNGADDDGSGTVSILEIADAFQQAVKDGNGPKRSILFLHVTGEEKGLLGSKYYASTSPIFPIANTVADLNIDMIGRVDPQHESDPNYVYLIGSDKLSTELHNISEEVNTKYINMNLDYTYNDDNDPNRFYYRSDHYNFAKQNVPIIFYFNGTHADYHRPSDTPDKIEYDLMEKRAKLVFYTAWEIANRTNRIVADKAMSK
ncbi:Zn-dependent amino-or carboxypeptidase, M28 family [Flavobacteriaceae bacterium MAR_2010_188]|nr:Zn-dependent amino-or carboxypeptidase, M28 family [Flavobacteriaceae bacterium MAR_2010_188]